MKKNKIDWVVNVFLKNKKNKPRKYKREAKKLKYCLHCKKTWEIGFGNVIHSYAHLPTYGLIRKKCRVCENKKGD
tara:strand:+ start:129 stop:353 length:225 start_codon:yes stop_codon:yes gene_type:complete